MFFSLGGGGKDAQVCCSCFGIGVEGFGFRVLGFAESEVISVCGGSESAAAWLNIEGPNEYVISCQIPL